jgi:hypothetical protein
VTRKGGNGTRKAFLLAGKVFHETFPPGNASRKGGNVTFFPLPSSENRGTSSEIGGTRCEKGSLSPEAPLTRPERNLTACEVGLPFLEN